MATITDLSKANDDWCMPQTTSRPQLLDEKGSDAEFRRTIYGIFTMTVNFDRIRERMATALGLSGIQYHILMVVAELSLEAAVTVSAVADRLHTSGAYVTMETKKLMRRGFLDKRPNPEDGRSVLLELTVEGREAIDAFAPHLRAINDELFDGIGPETFSQFRAIVDHMCRTSARAADMAEHIARDHTEIGGKVAGSVWR
ncbi:MAG: MarR family winged helix-turn-helix transcriptional regulator [Rhodospirillaceae bacterium]